MRLKKGLRLNNDTRDDIADMILEERYGPREEQARQSLEQVAMGVITGMWRHYSVEDETIEAWRNDLSGLYPVIREITLRVGHNMIVAPLPDGYAVPFGHYVLISGGYDRLDIDEKKAVADAMDQIKVIQTERGLAKNRILKFLAEFSAPKPLLERAPEFEKYLPTFFFEEEGEEQMVSLDDVLEQADADEMAA